MAAWGYELYLLVLVISLSLRSFLRDIISSMSYNELQWSDTSLSPRGFSGLIYNAVWGTLASLRIKQSTINFLGSERCPVQIRSDHNIGDYVPNSYRIVSGFFNVPYHLISDKGYETGPPVYSPYPRRLESLTICRCNYTFSSVILRPFSYFKTSSVILRPWVSIRPESNSRPPVWQPDAQPTEPPVRTGR